MEEPILKVLDNPQLRISRKDPLAEYDNLIEIGHGNFGKVYSATLKDSNNIVAIKKVDLLPKEREKIADVRRELEVLRTIKHANCIQLIDIFIEPGFVWIVMEFCVGSTKDLMNIIGLLAESQIAYILKFTLSALKYIHELGFIHRDIKADNILFSQTGVIKVADFGSSSMKSPTNTFVGTPFWMAPEVILAMDDGQYTSKADIWSTGITSYEFAEKIPPLFHLNTMSALYHISQNDPPQLLGDNWSSNYKEFTNSMLQKEDSNRPTAALLLDHAFLEKACDEVEFSEVLKRCYYQARQANETAAKKYVKYLSDVSTGESCEGNLDSDKSRIDELEEKMGVISLTDEIIKETMHESNRKNYDKNIGTIKTYDVIKNENNRRQDVGHIQVKDYQALRKANQKKLAALEQKLAAEIIILKKSHQKSLDLVKSVNEKAIRVLVDRYESEVEKIKRSFKNDLKNALKTKFDCAIERRNILNSLTNIDNLLFNRSSFYASLSTTSSPYETLSRSDTSSDANKVPTPKESHFQECEKVVMHYANQIKELLTQMYTEKNNLMVSHRESIGRMDLSNCSVLAQKELHKLEKIFQKKDHLLKKLHDYETQTQNEYVRQKIMALKKAHILDRRNRPTEFKNIESMFSKKYKTDVKNITEMYKNKIKNLGDKIPRESQAKIRNKLELEKINLILTKKKEMEHQICVFQEENVKQDDFQSKELSELEALLQQESQSLASYQASQMSYLSQTKLNELQCIHKRFEEIEDQIKKNINNDLKLLKDALLVEICELQKPFDFSFDYFIVKNKSLSQDVGNQSTSLLTKIENPYASLNFTKTRRKFLPEF